MVPAALTIEASGQHYVIAAGSTYHLNCDGKEYPAPHRGMLRCELREQGLAFERTVEGRLEQRWTFSLNADGLKLTEAVTSYSEGVSPSTDVHAYSRSSNPKHLLEGAWTGTKTVEVGGDTITLRVHDGSLYFRDARDGEITDARLDGTPSLFLSPGAPVGITWTNMLESERRIVGHPLRDGKAYGTDLMELSPDGKFIRISHADGTGNFKIFVKK